jgi:tryptophan halogenase
MKNICIVGGGTAGYIAALILKVRFGDNIKITVIKSDKIGIIGVGEGSTEHFADFLKFTQIHPYEVIKECDATLKSGIMFEGWTDKNFLHSVTRELPNIKFGQTQLGYQQLIINKVKQEELNNPFDWNSKVEEYHLKNKTSPVNQYHFNTFKLNLFLNKKCIERNISVIDDEINDVVLNEQGEIEEIKGTKKNYKFNFYIDCTGFKKILISKLGAKWQSYGKYLKMKEAIAFPTKNKKEYNNYTTAKAMGYGWMFQIPTFGRQGNGYIFDSDYINVEQAKNEVERVLGHSIDIGKNIKFDPGCLDNVWIKNCVAIGLSANFVEPLEATSIGTSIQQSYLLMHDLPNYDEQIIKNYNNKIQKIMDNIRDFICLHYITERYDTEFWVDIQKIELPESLTNKLLLWQKRLPIREDFVESNYFLFYEYNWIHILYGLNLLDIDNLKKQTEIFNSNVLLDNVIQLNNFKNSFTEKTIKHKEFLEKIRIS